MRYGRIDNTLLLINLIWHCRLYSLSALDTGIRKTLKIFFFLKVLQKVVWFCKRSAWPLPPSRQANLHGFKLTTHQHTNMAVTIITICKHLGGLFSPPGEGRTTTDDSAWQVIKPLSPRRSDFQTFSVCLQNSPSASLLLFYIFHGKYHFQSQWGSALNKCCSPPRWWCVYKGEVHWNILLYGPLVSASLGKSL